MGKIIITKDDRKKCDIIVEENGTITLTGQKNLVVNLRGDLENSKASRVVIGKMIAGGAEYEKDGN